jgi:hypothetical protein
MILVASSMTQFIHQTRILSSVLNIAPFTAIAQPSMTLANLSSIANPSILKRRMTRRVSPIAKWPINDFEEVL